MTDRPLSERHEILRKMFKPLTGAPSGGGGGGGNGGNYDTDDEDANAGGRDDWEADGPVDADGGRS